MTRRTPLRSGFSFSWAVLRRLGGILVTLLVIAYLTLFGLIMAERGREGLPARPLSAAAEATVRTATYLVDHPTTYYWNKEHFPSFNLVLTTLGRSAALLLLSLGVAAAVGVPLGIAAALARRRGGASLVLVLSILGVSTPSFLLAMLFWVLNILAHRHLHVTALPAAGFGWDAHLVMPTLVLAARPLAQVAQISYVTFSDILEQDYIRTARAKGLSWRDVRYRHALRNALIPILNALGTSLRFSLASLPVVEYFFHWPGVGLILLEAIDLGMTPLVTDLIVSLGLLFLLINLGIEFLYPILDPRLRGTLEARGQQGRRTWQERLQDLQDAGAEWWEDVRARLPGSRRDRPKLPPLPVSRQDLGDDRVLEPPMGRARHMLRAVLRNPALLLGTFPVVVMIGLVLFGGRLTEANPYELHGVMFVEGEIGVPPYPPSSVFPWGTDHIGRDVQALVLAGARQTLMLAFFGMVARVLLGVILGALAGWWRGGWFDRLVTGAVGVWAAFPATLFAMILIQALGIQQGMWVFVVTLCVVGWGEVAQFVRGQVIGIKPQLFIDAARSIGSRAPQILGRHVLPHLIAPLLVLAALEMGGVLMLLAELGFLNVFLGGGFRVMIAETDKMVPVIAYFSDVPEWGALLANIREWWRSYPWMAWYPGGAFSLAILTFNLFGEGLRRFLYEGRVNLSRLVNRYTLAVAAASIVLVVLLLRSTAPIAVYQSQAELFDTQQAMEDIRVLSSPEFAGRETGKPEAEQAAEYIAAQMRDIGLQAAGENDTFLQTLPVPRGHLMEVPRLEILDGEGNVIESLVYRQDFCEYAGAPTYGQNGEAMISTARTYGERRAPIIGLALGPYPETPGVEAGMMPGTRQWRDPYELRSLFLGDYVLLVSEEDIAQVNMDAVDTVLIVTADPLLLEKKHLHKDVVWGASRADEPVMYVTEEVADRMLNTAGTSWEELKRKREELLPGEVFVTDPGVTVHTEVVVRDDAEEKYYNVIGFIPGTGAEVGEHGKALDNQVILVSAYYDGLGMAPDGTLYLGANDNASAVAVMLELARALKQGPFQPKKTVVFVAWAGGERGESLSVSTVMSAKARHGFDTLAVEAVIELSGVGAGDGEAIALTEGSSFRLVQLFQGAAGRVGVSTTTRGRGPHHGIVPKSAYGGRSALSLYISWDGSDRTAHTSRDMFEAIDPQKVEKVGRTTLLVLTVLSRDVDY